ncbi:hypothetical protein [uncultured Psychroserpens sp.]|uniref:hypothetical protein n=1 Tax=uncultured Psychroserpens sp. TaxID=255436 RepID=UPI0026281D27|nr:hypothetical protein [uncultured Psychroserpens sp.]
MTYTYTNNFGEEAKFSDLNHLQDVLNKPYHSWEEGSGDSAIHIDDQQRLIFFKIKEGIFIMQHPDYLSPTINNDPISMHKHYVGGQEMSISSANLCHKTIAYQILKDFIETGQLCDDYEWAEITTE